MQKATISNANALNVSKHSLPSTNPNSKNSNDSFKPNTNNTPLSPKRFSHSQIQSKRQAQKELDALKQALREEEAKQEEALRRREEELGEGRWELAVIGGPEHGNTSNTIIGKDGTRLRVEMVGYSELTRSTPSSPSQSEEISDEEMGSAEDNSDDDDDSDASSSPASSQKPKSQRTATAPGRLCFNNFVSKSLPAPAPPPTADSANNTHVESEGKNPLWGLTSLSGGGQAGGPSKANTANMQCYGCGKMGHPRSECPERQSFNGSRKRTSDLAFRDGGGGGGGKRRR